MRKREDSHEPSKACPFLRQECLKRGCEIYNDRIDRCDLSLASYNLYLLADAINKQTESMKRP